MQELHTHLVRYFLKTIERSDVIERVNGGREAAVQTEDLTVDERRQWQVVEKVGKVFPNVGVAVLSQALVVKAVDLCDLPRLVITSQNCDSFTVAHLDKDTIKWFVFK